MNKEIEMLYKTLEAKDKIINDQVLEIARLKEWKEDLLNENIELENIRKEAIEYIKEHSEMTDLQICGIENVLAFRGSLKELLEILGDKE